MLVQLLYITMDCNYDIANKFGRLVEQDLDELADRKGWVVFVRR